MSCCFPFAVQCLVLVNLLAASEFMLRLSIGMYCAGNLGNDIEFEILKTCCMSLFLSAAAAVDLIHGLDYLSLFLSAADFSI